MTRRKIEITPTSDIDKPNTPLIAQDIIQSDCENYFEFHVKYSSPESRDKLLLLEVLFKKYNIFVSKSLITNSLNNQKVATIRLFSTCKTVAFCLFNQFIDELKDLQIQIIKTQKEYALFDTNVELDDGWAFY